MRRILPLVLAIILLTAAPSFASTPAPDAPRKAPTALFFGDSYFVGGGCSPDASRGMAAIAGRQLGYAPVTRGAGGTGFASANVEYGIPSYLAQIADGALDVANPALVVIEGGTNDYGRPLAKIRRNAGKVISIAQRKHPGAKIVLAGPMQTYGDFSLSDPIKTTLRQLAKKRGIAFINMQKWTYGHDDWLCSDYVHPTYAGQEMIAARLAQALAKRGA